MSKFNRTPGFGPLLATGLLAGVAAEAQDSTCRLVTAVLLEDDATSTVQYLAGDCDYPRALVANEQYPQLQLNQATDAAWSRLNQLLAEHGAILEPVRVQTPAAVQDRLTPESLLSANSTSGYAGNQVQLTGVSANEQKLVDALSRHVGWTLEPQAGHHLTLRYESPVLSDEVQPQPRPRQVITPALVEKRLSSALGQKFEAQLRNLSLPESYERPQRAANEVAFNMINSYGMLLTTPDNARLNTFGVDGFVDDDMALVTGLPIASNQSFGGQALFPYPNDLRSNEAWYDDVRRYLATLYPQLRVDTEKDRPFIVNQSLFLHGLLDEDNPAGYPSKLDSAIEAANSLQIDGLPADGFIRQFVRQQGPSITWDYSVEVGEDKFETRSAQLPPHLLEALVYLLPGLVMQESNYDPTVVSSANARGIFQQIRSNLDDYVGKQPFAEMSEEERLAGVIKNYTALYHRFTTRLEPELDKVATVFFTAKGEDTPDRERFELDFLFPLMVVAYNQGGGFTEKNDAGVSRVLKDFITGMGKDLHAGFAARYGAYQPGQYGLDAFVRLLHYTREQRGDAFKDGFSYWPLVAGSAEAMKQARHYPEVSPWGEINMDRQAYLPPYSGEALPQDPREVHQQQFYWLSRLATEADAEFVTLLYQGFATRWNLPTDWQNELVQQLQAADETELVRLALLSPQALREHFRSQKPASELPEFVLRDNPIVPQEGRDDPEERVPSERPENLVDPAHPELMMGEAGAKKIIELYLRGVRLQSSGADQYESGLRYNRKRSYLPGMRLSALSTFENFFTETGLMAPPPETDEVDRLYQAFMKRAINAQGEVVWGRLGFFLNSLNAPNPDLPLRKGNYPRWTKTPDMIITGAVDHIDDHSDRPGSGHFEGLSWDLKKEDGAELVRFIISQAPTVLDPSSRAESTSRAVKPDSTLDNLVVGDRIFRYQKERGGKFMLLGVQHEGETFVLYIDEEPLHFHVELIPWENYQTSAAAQSVGFKNHSPDQKLNLSTVDQPEVREYIRAHLSAAGTED